MDNTNKVEREVKTHYNNIASIITPNPFDFPFSIKKNFEGTVQLAINTFCCIVPRVVHASWCISYLRKNVFVYL